MKQYDNAKNARSKIMILVIIFLYIAAIIFNWNSLYYNGGIRDEDLYVAEAHLIANGTVPFSEYYSPAVGGAILYAPIAKLYTHIMGGTEGIFLFMRKAYFVHKLLVALILVLLFKRRFSLALAMMLPLPYLMLSFFNINTFYYNTLSISMLLISCVLMYTSFSPDEKYSRPFSFLGGVSMALAILAHPYQLATAVYMFFLILIMERKIFKTLFHSFLYGVGGLLTGTIITAYLSIKSGGIVPLINGMKYTLSSTGISSFKQTTVLHSLGSMLEKLSTPKGLILLGLLILGLLAFIGVCLYIRKITQADDKTICLFAALFMLFATTGSSIFFYLNFDYHSVYNIVIMGMNAGNTVIMLLLLFVVGLKKQLSFILLVFSPFVLSLAMFLFHFVGISRRGYLLFPSAMIAIALIYLALESNAALFLQVLKTRFNATENRKKRFEGKFLSVSVVTQGHIASITYAGTFILAFVFCCNYAVWYNPPLSQFTYQMEEGVYKGLFLSEDYGKALVQLEDEIQIITNAQDLLMFRDTIPRAYLMTKASHASPSAWDVLQYDYTSLGRVDENLYESAMDDYLLQTYFSTTGIEPTKIIYIKDKERPEELSLWDEDFPFNQYVMQNYTQTYTNGLERFDIIVFERKNHL